MESEQSIRSAFENSIYSEQEIADILGISVWKLNRKIEKKERWNAEEKKILSVRLHIPLYMLCE